MPTRTFTPDQLAAIGVPDPYDAEAAQRAEHLFDEQVDTRRWVSVHHLVFRGLDDGKAWRVEYVRGLTESQDGISPWEYAGPTIEAVEVEQVATTVMEWHDVEERYPTLLRIYCDTCPIGWGGDFIVTDTMSEAQRLDVVRAHVRTELGWQCDAAGDFCPECEPSAPTAAQAAPVTLPYVHTDCDGDTLTVRPALGLDAPTLIITAGNSSDHEQYATLVSVDEVPALVAAITRAAAVARRDDDADQAAPLHAAGRMAAEGLARGITQTKAERDHPTGDLFTEAAVSRSALLAGADVIEALPQDYECDPGRGDAVKLLRRLADHYTTAEQPTGPTWQARTDHAVRLYAMTAIERDDARAEAAKLRERLAELETAAAPTAPETRAAHPDQQAARRAILDSLGTLAHVAIWPHPGTDDMPENTDATTIEVSYGGLGRYATAYALRQVADRLAQLADATGDAPLDEDSTAAADERNQHLDAGVPSDATERPEDTARRFARRLTAVEQLCSGHPGYHTITVKQLLTAMSDTDDDQPATPAVPEVGDRYEKRDAPVAGRIVTVSRVWATYSGRTVVAYDWRDDKLDECGSACPIDVFHRAYKAVEEQPTTHTPTPTELAQAQAAHPDTVESLLDEIADDIPHRRAHAIAADYLARYTRLLAATAHAHSSQRGTEMRAEGYRGRAAWCSGMREIARQLDARADAIAEAGR